LSINSRAGIKDESQLLLMAVVLAVFRVSAFRFGVKGDQPFDCEPEALLSDKMQAALHTLLPAKAFEVRPNLLLFAASRIIGAFAPHKTMIQT
jgi:hypothetical protein